MSPEQELIVSGGMPPPAAAAFARLADLRVLMPTRYHRLDVDSSSMLVVCYGLLIEEHHSQHEKSPDDTRRLLVNFFSGGTTILAMQLAGELRTRSPSNRIFVSSRDWAESQDIRDHALDIAVAHGAAMTRKVAAFGAASCAGRLRYLRDHCGVDFNSRSKREIAEMAGISREMASRIINSGELDAPASKA